MMIKVYEFAMKRLNPGTDHSLTKVFISAALETIGWSIITPGLPTLHQSLSLSSASVGTISALISMIALASVVMQGMASDALGRVRLLSISSIAQLIGHVVLYGFAKKYITSIWIFVLFRVLPSIFKCGMIVSQAFVCDWIYSNPSNDGPDGLNEHQTATRNISTLMAYTNLGFIIGPILGGQLSALDPAFPFSAGCVVFMLNLLLLSQMSDPPREVDARKSGNGAPDDDPESGHAAEQRFDHRQRFIRSGAPVFYKSSIRPRNLSTLPLMDSEYRPYLSLSQSETHAGNRASKLNVGRVSRSTAASSRGSSVQPSLTWLLHVKFSFQVGNAIYESLFAQHLKDRLGTSSQDLGWLLGMVGLEAAAVNGILVRFVLAEPSRMWPSLIAASLIQGSGLALWALCASFSSAAIGAALIALSSNTFLSILQGLIARHSDSTPGATGQGGAGRTFGLSTSIDRAARTVAPIIGGIALERFGLTGFALTAGSTGIYSAAALTTWLAMYGKPKSSGEGLHYE